MFLDFDPNARWVYLLCWQNPYFPGCQRPMSPIGWLVRAKSHLADVILFFFSKTFWRRKKKTCENYRWFSMCSAEIPHVFPTFRHHVPSHSWSVGRWHCPWSPVDVDYLDGGRTMNIYIYIYRHYYSNVCTWDIIYIYMYYLSIMRFVWFIVFISYSMCGIVLLHLHGFIHCSSHWGITTAHRGHIQLYPPVI